MKKYLYFLCLFIIITSCSKDSVQEDVSNNEFLLETIQNDLRLIATSAITKSGKLNPYNGNGQYDNWGEAFFQSLEETAFINHEFSYAISKEKLLSIFKESINIEFSIIDTTNVDIKKSFLIFQEFITMYKNRDESEHTALSLSMENYIIGSSLLNEIDKSVLLKMNSILKYASYYSSSNQQKTNTKGATEQCFIRKLEELENAGYIEQALCIIDWPMCFGAKLLDCAISG